MQGLLARLARSTWLRRSLLTAAAIALVSTQTIGLHHRIEHGTASGWIDAVEPDHEDAEAHADHVHQDGDDPEHNCAAVDALALGDSPPAATVTSSVQLLAAAQAVGREQSSPESPRLRPFQARAPPTLLS
jgi:hypothetical protein